MKTLFAGILLSSVAFATPVVFSTDPGATVTSSGTTLPVSAQAAFALNGTSLNLTLFNNFVNPTSVLQNISDLYFDVYTDAGLYTGSASITGLSGTAVTVGSGGAFTTSSVTSLPASSWTLGFEPGSVDAFHLNALGTAQPQYTVIGAPDTVTLNYSTNGSFQTGSHNPFLQSGATFTLSFGGATVRNVNNVVFSFGTTPGIVAPGSQVPEPATFSMVGGILLLAALVLRRIGSRVRS